MSQNSSNRHEVHKRCQHTLMVANVDNERGNTAISKEWANITKQITT